MKKLLLILVCVVTGLCNAQNDSGGGTGVLTGGNKKDVRLSQYDKSGDPILIAGNGKKKDYAINRTDSGGNGATIGNGGGKKMDFTVCMLPNGDTGGSGGTAVGTTTLGKKKDYSNLTGDPIKVADPKKKDLALDDTGGGSSSPGSIKKQDLPVIKTT